MSANHSRNGEPCAVGSSVIVWSAPWHARLKNLADTGAAWKAVCTQAVSGASGSWMGRPRVRASSRLRPV